ncbi:MAG: peroxidase family protein [Gammaproteobacteria bacterium]|nr:peroxidase family protein [Gammaproteobacteria bacterium]
MRTTEKSLIAVSVTALMASATGFAQELDDAANAVVEPNSLLQEADDQNPPPRVSPARRINRQEPASDNEPPLADGYRSIDGSGNNINQNTMGAAGTPLNRWLEPAYWDGVSTLAGQDRPSARTISNAVSAQSNSIPNTLNVSDFLWQWGQFLDHDLDLTDGVDPPEAADIAVPQGDVYFDPNGAGTATIAFNRSLYDSASGTGTENPRQQLNEISGWIDASNVYGSDSERALALRTLDGSGRLRTSEGDLLPFNTEGLPNAGGNSATLFLAGDARANEQVGLTAMHTLFVREHNRLADILRDANPNLSGDEIYERARRMVGAEVQAITYREYLPVLLGPGAISAYRGYQANVDARITNEFATAAYRYGHSALSPRLLRLDAQGNVIPAGDLALRNAFFAPQRLVEEGGIAPILRGLAAQVCQKVDIYVIDDVRNFLFGPPGAGGFDLAALNIQRGRDHGIPSYNDMRAGMGLNPVRNFAEISRDPEIQTRLANAYGAVDDIDAWVGGLAEDDLPGAMVGELIRTVLTRQFEALRDGDRFWYQLTLTAEERNDVEQTRLADIIRRNSEIDREIPDDVFHVRNPA